MQVGVINLQETYWNFSRTDMVHFGTYRIISGPCKLIFVMYTLLSRTCVAFCILEATFCNLFNRLLYDISLKFLWNFLELVCNFLELTFWNLQVTF